MEAQKENVQKDHKPVGYGSSIQFSGHGNRTRPPQPVAKDQLITANRQKIEKDKEINE